MNDKMIIINASNERTFLCYKVKNDSELYQNFLTKTHELGYKKVAEGLKNFMVEMGFNVIEYGEKSTHHYALTKEGIYISSNGFVCNINDSQGGQKK